jgi:hypothetical protein
MMYWAAFDEDGICLGSGSTPDQVGTYVKPVPWATAAGDVFYDTELGQVMPSQAADLRELFELPEYIEPNDVLWRDIPANTRVFVEGEAQKGPHFPLGLTVPGLIHLHVVGRWNGTIGYPVKGYAELRTAAYGSLGDQLDMLYHDPEAWKAHISAVKHRFPK